MHKSMKTTVLALLLVSAAPLAYAQTTAPTSTTPPAARDTMSNNQVNYDKFTTLDGQLRAKEIIGSTVYDRQNQDIGSVKDVLFDRTGRVHSVVLDVGTFLGMGGKYVTVSLNDLKTDNNRLTLDKTKDQLRSAPEYNYRAG